MKMLKIFSIVLNFHSSVNGKDTLWRLWSCVVNHLSEHIQKVWQWKYLLLISMGIMNRSIRSFIPSFPAHLNCWRSVFSISPSPEKNYIPMPHSRTIFYCFILCVVNGVVEFSKVIWAFGAAVGFFRWCESLYDVKISIEAISSLKWTLDL